LADYLRSPPAAAPVRPGTWAEKAADLVRVDLPAAGLPVTKPGPDGRELVVNFYSLRYSAGLLAEEGGATLREVMTLMRHSDPKLTLRTYGRLQLGQLSRAVEKMPSALLPHGESLASGLPQLGPKLGQVADGEGERVREDHEAETATAQHPTLENVGDARHGGGLRESARSAPGGTRTFNPLIKSQLLCQLSYRGDV
jgi:hypothetical protein